MQKSKVMWILVVVAAALAGSALTIAFYPGRSKPKETVSASKTESLELVDFDGAQWSEDIEDTSWVRVKSGAELPSQLVAINLPDVESIEKPSLEEEKEEDDFVTPPAATATPVHQAAPVDLQNGKERIVPMTAVVEESEGDEESKITMIQAPVRYQVINTLEEYKKFKQKARGKYPEVDFSRSRVLVIESDSNLPDNMFELVDVTREDDHVLATYRVNVIGLNKKTNTHSVKVLRKSNLPIQLKQVL